VLPQVQLTVISLYSGWIAAFMAGSQRSVEDSPLHGAAAAQVKGRASLAAARRVLKHCVRLARTARFLIHRSCGQLCGRLRAQGAVFPLRLHICYLGQKMSRHFCLVPSEGYELLVVRLGGFDS
jgi:hypothetical protein